MFDNETKKGAKQQNMYSKSNSKMNVKQLMIKKNPFKKMSRRYIQAKLYKDFFR